MSINPAVIQSRLIESIQDIMAEQGYDLDEPIDSQTALVADLGFSSLDFVQLIVDVETYWRRKLGFQSLLVKAGTYVADIQVGELVAFVHQQLQTEDVGTVGAEEPLPLLRDQTADTLDQPLHSGGVKPDAQPGVTDETVALFRQTIRPRQLPPETCSDKNAQAIFVLCPPRSGSTLLRVILAGHPQLFSPPELYLLMYNDLAQRRRELAGEANSHLLEGTIRAIVELKGCSVEEAEQLMAEYERQELGTKQFYRLLQTWMGDRQLVDKTPLYPLDPSILARAEADFTDPLYIHLVRHPHGMIRSYEESQLDRFVPVLYENRFERRQLAELTWLVSHQNITEFLRQVPRQRSLQLSFESLVTQPQSTVRQLCEFLNLEFEPAMLNPYADPQQRMLAGARQLTRMPGDLKFHLHKAIDATTAHRWQQFLHDDFLSGTTWQLAESFGYQASDLRQQVRSQ